MKINYGHEYRKFAREQKEQREYFRSVGMTEEAIAEIEAFDKEEFLRTLAYKRNTQPLETLNAFEKDDESNSPLYDKFSYELTVTIDTYKPRTRYGWIDEIENPLLLNAIRELTQEQIEIITMLVFDEREQDEIAKILGINQSSVSRRIATIKKFFKEFLR